MSTAVQLYNPANDYEFSAYELYFYSKSDHQVIISCLTKLEFIKKQLGENFTALEAAILVAIVATKESYPLTLSLLPNYLADIASGLPMRQVIENINCYYGKVEASQYDYIINFKAGNLSPFIECPVDDSSVLELLELSPLVLSADDTTNLIDYSSLASKAPVILICDSNCQITSCNLLEAWSKSRKILNNSHQLPILSVSRSLAQIRLNPLSLYLDQLIRRGIFSSEDIIKLQQEALEEFEVAVPKEVDSKELDNSSLALWTAFLSGQALEVNLTKDSFFDLQKITNFPNRFFSEIKLKLKIDLADLLPEVFNFLLTKFYQHGEIIIDYSGEAISQKNLNLTIEFSEFSFPEELKDFYQYQSGSYFLEGEDITILTWGKAALAVNQWCLHCEIAPEIIILNNLTELSITQIQSSVEKTSKLILIPDPAMNFPLVDILINKLNSQIFNLLEIPIQSVLIDELDKIINLIED